MLDNEDTDTEKFGRAIGANVWASSDIHGPPTTEDEADTKGGGDRLVLDQSGRNLGSCRCWRSLGGSFDAWNVSVGAHM